MSQNTESMSANRIDCEERRKDMCIRSRGKTRQDKVKRLRRKLKKRSHKTQS